MRPSLVFVLATLGVLAACSSSSSSTTINASDYDQSCTTSADCVPVPVGYICGCASQMAAINVKDEARYEADVKSAVSHCPPSGGTYSCNAVGQIRLTCVAGRCGMVECSFTCTDGGLDDAGADASAD